MQLMTGLFAVAALTFSVQFASAQEVGDATAGAKVFRKCKACHTAEKTKNKVGPYLVGIVGRDVASVEGYKYSKAMKAHAETVPVWTEEALGEFLRNPRGTVKGTKMGFAGLKKDKDVADIIAYLKDPSAAK